MPRWVLGIVVALAVVVLANVALITLALSHPDPVVQDYASGTR